MWVNIRRMPLNSLGAAELKRRILAARTLRNVSQEELDRRFAEDGLRKSAGPLERGELPLTRARLDGLVRHLRVPEEWFVAEDVDSLVHRNGDASHLGEIERRLDDLEGLLRAQHQEVQRELTRLTAREFEMLEEAEREVHPTPPADAQPEADQGRPRRARGRGS